MAARIDKTRDVGLHGPPHGLNHMKCSGRSQACSQSFSPCHARLFARAEPSGTLRIWDTETGRVKHEYYLPSAACCCSAWAPNRRNVSSAGFNESPAKKKKRRSGASQAIDNSDLIAVGTTSGSVVLYATSKSDLSTHLRDESGGDGHSDRVTGVCWSSDGVTLFSCSLDSHIVMWNVATASIVHKWKGDEKSLYSIHVCHTQKHLLTASRHIKLWDLHTRLVLKTFVGHASEVFSLHMVAPASKCSNRSDCNGADESQSSIDGSYIVSAAVNDRKLNVWRVGVEDSKHEVISDVTVSFTLQENPVEVHVKPARESEPFQLAVLTQSGKLNLFEHVLNGRLKKPLKPLSVLELATSGTSKPGDRPLPLPIVSSGFVDDSNEPQIVIAYEDVAQPVFEKLHMQDLKPGPVCLLRDKPNGTSDVQTCGSVSKVETSQASKEPATLTSVCSTNSLPHVNTAAASGKKKRKLQAEMTLEERLNALDTDASKSSAIDSTGKGTSKIDSLTPLLEQALKTNDRKIIQGVLQRSESVVIRNTVGRLSASGIVLLVKELTRRMHGNAISQHTVMQWVNSTLTQHKTLLTSLPDAIELLEPLQKVMCTPTELLQRLLQVNIQLKSFLTQGANAAASSETNSIPPLNADQDEASSDEMDFEELNHDVVVSEEEWENMDDSLAESDDSDKDGKEDDSDDS